MSVVHFDELKRMAGGVTSKAAVRRYLKARKILYEVGTNGAPWTTTEAINRVLLPTDGPSELNLDACGPRSHQATRSRRAAR